MSPAAAITGSPEPTTAVLRDEAAAEDRMRTETAELIRRGNKTSLR
jgi:hypothetical protein